MQTLAPERPFAARHRIIDALRRSGGYPRLAALREGDLDVLLEEVLLLEAVAQAADDLTAWGGAPAPHEPRDALLAALRRWRE